ncbi:MAG: hypothetical protein AB7S68_01850 [Polyangiaceae bacterium]
MSHPTHTPERVLFVCVHNAARSRMAEALLRDLGRPIRGGEFWVRVGPLVIEALAQIGLSVPRTDAQPSSQGLVSAAGSVAVSLGKHEVQQERNDAVSNSVNDTPQSSQRGECSTPWTGTGGQTPHVFDGAAVGSHRKW